MFKVMFLALVGTAFLAWPTVVQAQNYVGASVSEEAPPETNQSRAEESIRQTLINPQERKGVIPSRVFARFWAQGLKEMFAVTSGGELKQVREWGFDGKLHDIKREETTEPFDESFGIDSSQTMVIVRKIGDGLYLSRMRGEQEYREYALELPGALLADGDAVKGHFERVGIYSYGTRNLAKYCKVQEEATAAKPKAQTPVAETETLTPADVKTVYAAFNDGKITFVARGSKAMSCLACEGTGRKIDQAELKREARKLYRSNYNQGKSYKTCVAEAKEKLRWGSPQCPECQGRRSVQVPIFVKYSVR